jgi:branched-subunit amino acid ABC-type transport system permease component
MDLRRLRVGEWIVGACGALLLVALCLPWYGPGSASAWEAFTVLDVILALLAVAAMSVPIATATQRVPAMPLALESLTALFATIGVLLVLIRVLNLPGDADGREIGLWLGLAATLGIAAGALIAIRDERRSPKGRHTDLSGVPVNSPPQIEQLPAPRPGTGS